MDKGGGLRLNRRNGQEINFYHEGILIGNIHCTMHMVKTKWGSFEPQVELKIKFPDEIDIARAEVDEHL